MQEMQIYGVSFDLVGKQPIVLLKTAEGNKFLPIWIGHPEAAAILMKLQSASTPRPMTHDLVTDMLDQLGAQVTRITVTELRENTFYAQITVQLGAERGAIAAKERLADFFQLVLFIRGQRLLRLVAQLAETLAAALLVRVRGRFSSEHLPGINRHRFNIARLQPLPNEVFGQRVRTRVG